MLSLQLHVSGDIANPYARDVPNRNRREKSLLDKVLMPSACRLCDDAEPAAD
jgi:hypothetical protein